MSTVKPSTIKWFKMFLGIFGTLSISYWFYYYVYLATEIREYYSVFGILLTILTLFGVISGFIVQNKWGSYKSLVGRSLLFITLGLLMWFVGNIIYLIISLSQVGGTEMYPSIADYFFILIDPFYAVALLIIMKYSGVMSKFKKVYSYLILLLVPIACVYANYLLFFSDYSSLKDILVSELVFDLVYTFGSIAVMTLVILAFALSLGKLGGMFKKSLYMFFIGFALQYIADVFYSLRMDIELYNNGGVGDVLFFCSVFFIIFGVLFLNPSNLKELDMSNENNSN